MKNNKGITLIALIITIIVLIILAGIGMAMVAGDNGVLSNADKARRSQVITSVDDKVGLAEATIETSIRTGVSEAGTTYVATNPTIYEKLVKDIAEKDLKAVIKKAGGTSGPEDPEKENFSVYGDLLVQTGSTGEGCIVITYADNSLRASLPGKGKAEDEGYKAGGSFKSGRVTVNVEDYDPDDAVLVYVIKVTNYGDELSQPVLTTVTHLKAELKKGENTDDSSYKTFTTGKIYKTAFSVSDGTQTTGETGTGGEGSGS